MFCHFAITVARMTDKRHESVAAIDVQCKTLHLTKLLLAVVPCVQELRQFCFASLCMDGVMYDKLFIARYEVSLCCHSLLEAMCRLDGDVGGSHFGY